MDERRAIVKYLCEAQKAGGYASLLKKTGVNGQPERLRPALSLLADALDALTIELNDACSEHKINMNNPCRDMFRYQWIDEEEDDGYVTIA